MIASLQQPLTIEEYLEWEKAQELRHEYLDGEIYAMTGGSKAHNAIAINLARELSTHLRTSSCNVFVSDVKVQSAAQGPVFYPDLLVTCDERDNQAGYVVEHPCLIVEILSPSTERFDRGAKFRQYRSLAALQEYVLIGTQEMSVECFRRSAEVGVWSFQPYSPGDAVRFESIGLELPVDILYEKVLLEPGSN
ncbi:MAG: Uma2 family endonuclease [Gemmatimonadaceae bacterium]|nr:Uma2 family endonuclease [Gloeobacterales cyanobacterium ES-bin-141]